MEPNIVLSVTDLPGHQLFPVIPLRLKQHPIALSPTGVVAVAAPQSTVYLKLSNNGATHWKRFAFETDCCSNEIRAVHFAPHDSNALVAVFDNWVAVIDTLEGMLTQTWCDRDMHINDADICHTEPDEPIALVLHTRDQHDASLSRLCLDASSPSSNTLFVGGDIPICAISCCPFKSDYVAAGFNDGSLSVIDGSGQVVCRLLGGEKCPVSSMQWSPELPNDSVVNPNGLPAENRMICFTNAKGQLFVYSLPAGPSVDTQPFFKFECSSVNNGNNYDRDLSTAIFWHETSPSCIFFTNSYNVYKLNFTPRSGSSGTHSVRPQRVQDVLHSWRPVVRFSTPTDCKSNMLLSQHWNGIVNVVQFDGADDRFRIEETLTLLWDCKIKCVGLDSHTGNTGRLLVSNCRSGKDVTFVSLPLGDCERSSLLKTTMLKQVPVTSIASLPRGCDLKKISAVVACEPNLVGAAGGNQRGRHGHGRAPGKSMLFCLEDGKFRTDAVMDSKILHIECGPKAYVRSRESYIPKDDNFDLYILTGDKKFGVVTYNNKSNVTNDRNLGRPLTISNVLRADDVRIKPGVPQPKRPIDESVCSFAITNLPKGSLKETYIAMFYENDIIRVISVGDDRRFSLVAQRSAASSTLNGAVKRMKWRNVLDASQPELLHLATGSNTGVVTVYGFHTKTFELNPVSSFRQTENRICGLDWVHSPEQNQVVFASYKDKNVYVCNGMAGEVVSVFSGHRDELRGCVTSPLDPDVVYCHTEFALMSFSIGKNSSGVEEYQVAQQAVASRDVATPPVDAVCDGAVFEAEGFDPCYAEVMEKRDLRSDGSDTTVGSNRGSIPDASPPQVEENRGGGAGGDGGHKGRQARRKRAKRDLGKNKKKERPKSITPLATALDEKGDIELQLKDLETLLAYIQDGATPLPNHLAVYGSSVDVKRLVADELSHAEKEYGKISDGGERTPVFIFLTVLTKGMSGLFELLSSSDSGDIPSLIAAMSGVGTLWCVAGQTAAKRLAEKNELLASLSLLYALGAPIQSLIEACIETRMYRDAIVLAKYILSDDDPLVASTMEAWADNYMTDKPHDFNLRVCKLYLCLGKYAEAIDCLSRVPKHPNASLLGVKLCNVYAFGIDVGERRKNLAAECLISCLDKGADDVIQELFNSAEEFKPWQCVQQIHKMLTGDEPHGFSDYVSAVPEASDALLCSISDLRSRRTDNTQRENEQQTNMAVSLCKSVLHMKLNDSAAAVDEIISSCKAWMLVGGALAARRVVTLLGHLFGEAATSAEDAATDELVNNPAIAALRLVAEASSYRRQDIGQDLQRHTEEPCLLFTLNMDGVVATLLDTGLDLTSIHKRFNPDNTKRSIAFLEEVLTKTKTCCKDCSSKATLLKELLSPDPEPVAVPAVGPGSMVILKRETVVSESSNASERSSVSDADVSARLVPECFLCEHRFNATNKGELDTLLSNAVSARPGHQPCPSCAALLKAEVAEADSDGDEADFAKAEGEADGPKNNAEEADWSIPDVDVDGCSGRSDGDSEEGEDSQDDGPENVSTVVQLG